jgi:hypothetical protein
VIIIIIIIIGGIIDGIDGGYEGDYIPTCCANGQPTPVKCPYTIQGKEAYEWGRKPGGNRCIPSCCPDLGSQVIIEDQQPS